MLRIGSGAGFSGDRIEPAETLVKHANLDYLVLECLAERTIALAQQRKLANDNEGYDPLLEKRMKKLLPLAIENNVRLITNMGAANPIGAAEKVLEIARQLDIPCKVAVVTGDDVLNEVDLNSPALENNRPISDNASILSANAYLGADAILPALETDANIIITGRVADPSLFLAPQMYHFNWRADEYEKLGQGLVTGHLLECASQVSGGYFADGYKKVVQDLHHIGFPFATIDSDGSSIISKVEGTGGMIDLRTVKEQLLYEIHDPKAYMTPDAIVDFTRVQLEEIGRDKVKVTNGSGKERPQKLKVSVGYHAGFLGEGEISYAGSYALEKADMAKKVLIERLSEDIPDLRVDFIGLSSVHRTNFSEAVPYEIRLRAAGYHQSKETAKLIGEEVEALYLNGPAAGGGARKKVSESIGVLSTFIGREKVVPQLHLEEWKPEEEGGKDN